MTRLWFYRMYYIGVDIVCTVVAFTLFNFIRYEAEELEHSFGALKVYLLHGNALVTMAGVLALALGVYALSGYYNKPFAKSRVSDLTASICSSLIIATAVFLVVVSDDILSLSSYYLSLYGYLLGLIFLWLYLGRSIVTYFLLRLSRKAGHRERILLIGQGRIADEMAHWLEGEGCMQIVHRVSLEPSMPRERAESLLDSIIDRARETSAEAIVIATTDCTFADISQILYGLYVLGIPIRLSPRSIPYAGIKLRVSSVLGEPLVDITASNMSESSRNIKWLMDKVGALAGLILLSPLLLYTALRVARDSSGGVFFSQERIGHRGKPFMIYKFRSMYTGAEAAGPMLSREDDPRITPWGRTMRKYRLDELPQLWNVLRGDMSLVGPRPERSYYIERLREGAPQLFLLHNVRPGITSWAMVRYGYASSLEEMQERMAYDWLYYENMSLRLDLVVLFYTIQTIITGKGK